jgi:hypothetical protein
MKRLIVAVAAASVMMGTAGSAGAYVVSLGGAALPNEGLTTTVAGATTINFNGGFAPGNYAGGAVVSGNSTGLFLEPGGDSSFYFTVGTNTAVGVATLPGLANYFGLHWGSMDAYNSLTLSRGGVNLLTLTGDQFLPDRDAYVNIFASNSGEYFDRITFSSSTNAFESDNHAVRMVPEPSSYAMMAAGLMLAGLVMRRRVKQ